MSRKQYIFIPRYLKDEEVEVLYNTDQKVSAYKITVNNRTLVLASDDFLNLFGIVIDNVPF